MPSRPVPKERLIALHVGSLATSAGHDMVAYWRDEMLPALASSDIDLQIRVVGNDGGAPAEFLDWSRPELVFTGHLDSIVEEVAQADIFLCPLKYPVGVRTRIITALAYGLPVIADRTAAAGLPELVDGRDILFTSSGPEIAEAVRLIGDDGGVRHGLSRSARLAWETFYDPRVNAPVLFEPFLQSATT